VHKLVEHGGNLDGFSLEFAFLAEDQIGVIVLAHLKSIVFDRVPEKQIFDKAFLEQFVGDYDFMGRTLSRSHASLGSIDYYLARWRVVIL
jgi:hypothetical protein